MAGDCWPSIRSSPPMTSWEAQHEGQLHASARWVSAAISRAVAEHARLLFVHSHPDPRSVLATPTGPAYDWMC